MPGLLQGDGYGALNCWTCQLRRRHCKNNGADEPERKEATEPAGDEWKTTFRTKYGHYEYQVMPFVFTNSLATFQSYINRALSDLLDICCVVYLDDILTFSQNEEDHVRHVQMVLARLRQYRQYCKLSKYAFHTQRVSFLAFIITPGRVQMEDRIQTVRGWPEPRSVKDIQVFLGFANFYRRFIEGYSCTTVPLSYLTKDAGSRGPFTLTDAARSAFGRLKERALNCASAHAL